MIYLVISWLLINFVHGYGVYINRHKSLATISENLVSSPKLLLLYRIAHLINGLLILGITDKLSELNSNSLVIVMACLSVFFEWAQAIVPYKNKWKSLHHIFAVSMAVSMILFGWSIFMLSNITGLKHALALLAGSLAILCFTYVKNPPRRNTWLVQTISINAVYLQVAMVTLSQK